MWLVMVVAMMLPSSLPWVVTFAGLTSGSRAERRRQIATFLGGYGLVWASFAAAAAATQVALQNVGALSAPGPALSSSVGGVVLVGVGLFQFTGLKEACLSQCRSPVSFFLSSWIDGPGGAFRMGTAHGRHCLGCCWALMVAAFVVGIMNLAWMGVLTVVMVVEKLVPEGKRLGKGVGVVSIFGGLWLILGS
jgi:predicted metal-binding membrane protein